MSKFNAAKIEKLKKIDRTFKSLYLFPKNRKTYQPVNKADVREILLMGIWLIGDTIMHLPVINVIKKNYPNSRITVVCEKQSEIILKSQNLVDRFIIIKCPWVAPVNYSLKNLTKFFFSARIANGVKYDLAFEFRGDWRSIFYMNFINAERKISYDYSGGEYMLTDAIVPDTGIENLTAESLHLLKQFGCTYDETETVPRLNLSMHEKEFVAEFKAERRLGGKFLIGIHPGTTQVVKRWDENKYSELILKLSKTYNDCVFLLYEGPNERNTVEAIEQVLEKNNIEYVVINKTLREYVLLVSLCQIMICNDSGAAHIAGAYNIPVIVIFGSRGPEFVFPFGSRQQEMISHKLDCKPCLQTYCKFGTLLCLTSITVNEVFDKVRPIADLLAKNIM